MHRMWVSLSIALLALSWASASAVAAPAGGAPRSAAATSADPATIEQDAEQAIQLAEDLSLLQALNPLQLTTAQIDQIVPLVNGVQAKWKELDLEEMRTIAARKSAMAEARTVALRGGRISSRLLEQLSLYQETIEKKQEAYRRDYVVSLSGKLSKILSQTQQQQIRANTEAALTGRPSPYNVVRITAGTIAGAEFKFDNDAYQSPEDEWADEIEKLRKAKGEQVAIRRSKFADKFLKGLDGDSPEYKAQLDAMMQQADSLYAMSPDQFQAERKSLGQRYAAMRAGAKARSKARKAAMGSVDPNATSVNGLEFFVNQILLSDRTAVVLRDMRTRLASGS